MSRITGALRATYYFFSGDVILLGAVALAFVLATLLVRAAHAPNVVVALVFVACIVGGLATTLRREVGGARRR